MGGSKQEDLNQEIDYKIIIYNMAEGKLITSHIIEFYEGSPCSVCLEDLGENDPKNLWWDCYLTWKERIDDSENAFNEKQAEATQKFNYNQERYVANVYLLW